MTATEKTYIIHALDACLDKMRAAIAKIEYYDPKDALISLKAAINAMQTDDEKLDDWSTEVEARLDRLEQRLSWVEFTSIGIGRKGGGGRGNSVFDS